MILPETLLKMISHYKILNVPENATPLQIKKAFRKLALRYHPDQTKSQNSIEFLRIKNSYDILVDSNKRVIYDKQLYDSRNPKPHYTQVDLETLKRELSHKENWGATIFNFILRIMMASLIIIITMYSCEFVENNILGDKKTRNSKNIDSYDNRTISDSIISEDQKLEKELQGTTEKTYINGEIKF